MMEQNRLKKNLFPQMFFMITHVKEVFVPDN